MFCAWHCWLVTANRHSWRPKSLPWARDRGNNMCCVSQTHPQPPVVAGRARGLGQTGRLSIDIHTHAWRNATPAGRACLCKGEEGSRTWGKCRANTRSWRAQRFSHATLGRGCGVRVLRPVRLLLPPGRAVQTDHLVCTPCARHQQSCSTGKQSHGGRRSATWCLGSHSAEAAYRSRALGRIVWRASATRRTAPASTLSG